MLFLINLN